MDTKREKYGQKGKNKENMRNRGCTEENKNKKKKIKTERRKQGQK